MKTLSAGCLLFAAIYSAPLASAAVQAKSQPLQPASPQAEAMPVARIVDRSPTRSTAANSGVFTPIAPTDPVIVDIVDRFTTVYAKEMSQSSLLTNVSAILKAERTDIRGEIAEKELDSGGLGIDFAEETQSQQYRIFLLMKYEFQSAMLGHNRPYVTVTRLTMDCYNTTSATADTAIEEQQTEYDATTETQVQLACDVLDHIDMARRNESTKSIPSYLQRQIFHSAPASYIHNHSLQVFYDAVEAQDLAFDANGNVVENRDTMHYVRFRVQGGIVKDCVIAVEHAKGINTLRYLDTVCYDEASDNVAVADAAAATSHFAATEANAPVFVLIASITGACVAVLLIWRQRQSQRSGYSYLRSGTSKLSHVPGEHIGTTNTDAAIAY